MDDTTRNARRLRKVPLIAAAAVAVLLTAGCAHVMHMFGGGPTPPPESEFGLGPRTTAAGTYTVTLQPPEPLAKRKLQKVHVQILDSAGVPVEDAVIDVDGGMPAHGHGLPTQPRMTRRLGAGRYEIDGVRFNMGGWWEFELRIAAAPGTDSVTFNLDL